jgi:hypothetical protein
VNEPGERRPWSWEEFSLLFKGAAGLGSSLTGEEACLPEECPRRGASGAPGKVREMPGERRVWSVTAKHTIVLPPGRTLNRSRSPRLAASS